MKDIQLLRIAIDNFKGLHHFDMDFSGQSCTVYGDNATGKTSLYDALLWLLFDKDSWGQTNFDVKPLDPAGQIKDNDAVTAVEAALSVDGQTVTFRRELREVWTNRRGGTKTFFEGNASSYFMDGVPMKKQEFARRLSEIIREDTFRLLTAVTYFCSDMPWKDRRTILFEVCGSMPERSILEQATQFSELAAAAGPLCVDDLKKKLMAERKGLSGTRNDIPARIDECQKTVDDLRGIDFPALRLERDSRAEKRDKLAAELAQAENNSLLDSKINERDALKNQLAALETENMRFKARQTVPDTARMQLEQERATLDGRVATWSADFESARSAADSYAVEVDRCRSSWKAENAQTYSGGTCPTCGQALAGTALQTASARFQAQKRDRLAAIVRDSEIIKEKCAHEEKHKTKLAAQIDTATRRLDEIGARLTAMPRQEQPQTVTNMDGYAANQSQLMANIAAADAEILRLSADKHTAGETVRQKIGTLDGEIKAIETTLAKESILTYTQSRIAELRTRAVKTAAQIEKLDSLLNLIDEFTRYKVQFIEKSVNSHFKLARFRLFAEQVNGGLSDCCEVTYNGVPYGSLNNGARINVGLDAIETLSTHYGVRVPLFVDNAESVTRLRKIDAQIIRLEVSERDKELRCEAWA